MRKIESAIVIVAYLIISVLLISDVLLREIFGTSIYGAQRVAVFAMIISGFLGLGLAADYGRHLRPRFADWLIPNSYTKIAERTGSLIMSTVYIYFAWLGVSFVRSAYEFGEKARTIDIPIWTIQMVVPLAFLSVGMRYLSYTIWPELKPDSETAA